MLYFSHILTNIYIILIFSITVIIIYDYLTIFSILIDEENNSENKKIFIQRMIKNNFYISNSYYDSRYNIIRILVAYNPSNKYQFKVIEKNMNILNYSLILYDKNLKSENHFQLKYGNIIIKYNKMYDTINIVYQNIWHNVIINYNDKIKRKYNLTWCLTSLRNNYDAIIQFNETINLSIHYKVDRIILYYSDVSNRILRLIKMYELKGIVESYYWEENSEICNMKICGKLLQLNDCFYKSIYNTIYLLNVDIDEIIIPKIHKNYLSFLKWSNDIYSYSNMLIFYTKLCVKSREIFEEKRKSPKDYFILPKVVDKSIYSISNCCIVSVLKSACSKYIIKPAKIEALWLHDVWSGEYNYSIIPIHIAYTRHTRHLSYGLNKVCHNYTTDIL